MPLDQPAKSLRRVFAEVLGSVLFVSILTIAFYQYYSDGDARSYGRVKPAMAASVVVPASRSSAAYISPQPSPVPAPKADGAAVPLRQVQPPLAALYGESGAAEADAGTRDNYIPNDR